MEKWHEFKKGCIPKDTYMVKLQNGEEGLSVKLIGLSNIVEIDFGCVRAIRMLDEGVVIDGFYSQYAVDEYKENNFENVIYLVDEGSFKKEVVDSACGFYKESELLHFIVVNQNFCIDVITEWEPVISLS